MPRWLLRDGEVVPDEWRTPSEAAPGDDLLLTFAEWCAERERWLTRPELTRPELTRPELTRPELIRPPESSRAGRLGVILSPSDAVELLVPDLPRLALVGAEFPGPSEGRGYSQGRLLRERFGFAGELRACGRIGRDHVFLLARCGFNSFELPESELEGAKGALRTFSAAYQRSSDAGLAVRLGPRCAGR
jgi:uncharacterized protein (DUF934 family)